MIQRRPRISCRGIIWLIAILLMMAPSSKELTAATIRQIYDGSALFLTNGNPNYYLDHFNTSYGYTFGRSEGMPVRGPNPITGSVYSGSTDVDDLYDLVPDIMSYYMTKFGRNGPNGFGGTGDGVSVPTNVFLAAANANIFRESTAPLEPYAFTTFVTGSNPLILTVVLVNVGSVQDPDLLGHEFAHIFTNSMRYNPNGSRVRLISNQDEGGALNEGLSDFFGEAFERYTTGSIDWKLTVGSDIYRNSADPTSLFDDSLGSFYPDRYLSPYFLEGNNVHHNSTVLTHGLYLAVEGGIFNGFTIDGIGFDKVEQIVYRAVTEHFQTNETFNQAYAHLLQATSELYGPTELAAMTAALQSVEMNQIRVVPEPSLYVLGLLAASVLFVRRCHRRGNRLLPPANEHQISGTVRDWRR